jgi:hypothetical protein
MKTIETYCKELSEIYHGSKYCFLPDSKTQFILAIDMVEQGPCNNRGPVLQAIRIPMEALDTKDWFWIYSQIGLPPRERLKIA